MKNKLKGLKKSWIVFSFLFCFFPFSLRGIETEIQSLQGIAQVLIERHGKSLRFDQAVSIQKNETSYLANFETLDDFGNTWVQQQIEIFFNESSQKLKKWLKLPLTDQEIMGVLLAKDCPLRKGYKIYFFDLQKHGRIIYPHKLVVQSKKTTFEMKWSHVSIR